MRDEKNPNRQRWYVCICVCIERESKRLVLFVVIRRGRGGLTLLCWWGWRCVYVVYVLCMFVRILFVPFFFLFCDFEFLWGEIDGFELRTRILIVFALYWFWIFNSEQGEKVFFRKISTKVKIKKYIIKYEKC